MSMRLLVVIVMARPAVALAPARIAVSMCDAQQHFSVYAPSTTDPSPPAFAFTAAATPSFVPPATQLRWSVSGSLGVPRHPLGVFSFNASGVACGDQAVPIYDGVFGMVNLSFPSCPWRSGNLSIDGRVGLFTPLPVLPPLLSAGLTLEWSLHTHDAHDGGEAELLCARMDLWQPAATGAERDQDRCGITKTPSMPHYPPAASVRIPEVVVDLDDPPELRWARILAPRRAVVKNLVNAVIAHLPYATQLNSTLIKLLLAADADVVMRRFPPDFASEIRGVAKITGVPLGFLFVLNMAYELMGLCTSLVAQDSQGVVWHARNLDFGLFMGTDPQRHVWALTQPLRDALLNVRFVRRGQPLFTATTYCGFVGVHSGMRHASSAIASESRKAALGSEGASFARVGGAFSITVNTRFDSTFDAGIIEFLLGLGAPGREFMTFHVRRTLEQNATYAEAVEALTDYSPLGPGYLIVAGSAPGDGAVITKQLSRGGGRVPPTKSVRRLADALREQRFYVAQTNYDADGPPPAYDDRRYPVEDCLQTAGQAGVTPQGLFRTMSANPTRNALTTFTMLMAPQLGRFEAYKQKCDPSPHCSPF